MVMAFGDITAGERMSRQLRNYNEGEIYHVIQRGNNQAYIFADQIDKSTFLEIISETLERYPCMLLYYCLMDNHYHLLLEMMQTDLSKIMHRINLFYSKYYNQKYNRSGTIFGRRYSSYLVKDNSHFYALVLYIAYNPVKANMVKTPDQYHWCAHLDIIFGRRSIVDKSCLLSRFHRSLDKAKDIYVQLIDGGRAGSVQYENHQEIITEKRRQSLEVYFQETIDDEILEQRIIAGNREKDVIKQKKCFIRKARTQGFSVEEIARFLGITARAVRYYLHRP